MLFLARRLRDIQRHLTRDVKPHQAPTKNAQLITHTKQGHLLMGHMLTLSLITASCAHAPEAPAAPERSRRSSSYDADLLHIEAALAIFNQAPDQARFERGLQRLEQVRSARSLRIHQDALAQALEGWPHTLRAVPRRWEITDAPPDELRRWLWRLPRHLDITHLKPALTGLDAPHTDNLTSFSVSGDERFLTLLKRRARVGIKRLELSNITMRALHALMAWPQRQGLEALAMWDTRLGAALSQALVKAGPWPALTTLDVGSNRLGELGIGALGRLEAPRLEALRLDWNGANDEGVRLLFSNPRRAKLKLLGLDHNNLSAQAIRTLVAHESLIALETLTLEGNPIKDEGAQALSSRADRLNALKRLKLGQTQLGALACEALSALNAPALAHLDLSENLLTDECTPKLLKANYVPRLRALLISKAQLTQTSAAALASSPLLSLAALDLSENQLDAVSCQRLISSAALQNIEALSLANNEVGPSCTMAIVARAAEPHALTKLVSLDLSQTGLDDEALSALLASALSPQLISLKLAWNPLERSAQALSKAKLTALTTLSLEGVSLKGQETQELARLLSSAAFMQLEDLNLGWSGLDDASLAQLARWPQLKALESLSLKGNSFTTRALKAFIEHAPLGPGPSKQLIIDFAYLLSEP